MWSGDLNSQSALRLDPFLVLEEWEDHFSGLSQLVLIIAPLCLRGKGSIWAKHPLNFRLCGLRLRALKISLDLGVRGMMLVVLSIIVL